MKILLFIFFAELAWSYTASRVTIELVRRRVWRALFYDALALSIAYEILAILSRNDWDHIQVLFAVMGGVAGTGLVAGRKKRKVKKGVPVNV